MSSAKIKSDLNRAASKAGKSKKEEAESADADTEAGGGERQSVWVGVSEYQDKLRKKLGVKEDRSASCLQLISKRKDIAEAVATYESALKVPLPANVIGLVTVINGEVSSADVYGSPHLFISLLPKLLSARITEAVAERHAERLAVPSVSFVQEWLASAEMGESRWVKSNSITLIETRQTAKAISD